MHGKFAAAKVSTFVVSDFCVVWDFDCQRLCITPLVTNVSSVEPAWRRDAHADVLKVAPLRHCSSFAHPLPLLSIGNEKILNKIIGGFDLGSEV